MSLPSWFKIKPVENDAYRLVAAAIETKGLHTVCQSSGCPNRWECWGSGTATFLILGNICTRNCAFCGIPGGKPTEIDLAEPARVADAVRQLGIRHAVITSVTRDDLSEGGAGLFAETVNAIRSVSPFCSVELLIPDFQGSREALEVVMQSRPEVLAHNVETVPRLYCTVRPGARYERSLRLLERVAAAGLVAKSGLITGMGETLDEVEAVMRDLVQAGCRNLTIGQYLNPGNSGIAVDRFLSPEEFDTLRGIALSVGFSRVISGPLVRSSYKAAV